MLSGSTPFTASITLSEATIIYAMNCDPLGDSVNRNMCAEVKSEYIERAGVDPSKPVAQPGLLPTPAKKSPAQGGSARVSWQNVQLAVWKQLHAPGRKITDTEIEQLRATWDVQRATMSDSEYQDWKRVSECERHARVIAASQPAVLDLEGWTRCSGKETNHREALPIPLLNLRAAYSGGGSHERRSRAAYDKRVDVTEALPRVTQRPPRPLGHCPVFGCFGKKINVCRYVMAPEYLRRFDLLVHRFNSWVDSFTAATARSSACLLMLRGDHHIDHLSPPLDFIVLLVRCRFNPKVHIVCCCWLKDTPGEFQLTLPGVDGLGPRGVLQGGCLGGRAGGKHDNPIQKHCYSYQI